MRITETGSPHDVSAQNSKLQRTYLDNMSHSHYYVVRVAFNDIQVAFEQKLLTKLKEGGFTTSDQFLLGSNTKDFTIDVQIYTLRVTKPALPLERVKKMFTFYHIMDPIVSKVKDIVLRHMTGSPPPPNHNLFFVDPDSCARLCWLSRKSHRGQPIFMQAIGMDIPPWDMLHADKRVSPVLVTWR